MKLKFVAEISGKQVLVTPDQLGMLWDVLHGCETVEDKWVGTNKGTVGPNKEYTQIVRTFEAYKDLNLRSVSEEYVDAIKFVMKQQEN